MIYPSVIKYFLSETLGGKFSIQLSTVRENRGERNWFARHRVTKEGFSERKSGGGGGGGGSLVRRNANSDNEGVARRGWRGRSFARPSRKFRRPPRFRCRRPYNRRAPNSGSEIVRALVAYGRNFCTFLRFFCLSPPSCREPARHISRNCNRNCIKPTRLAVDWCRGIVDRGFATHAINARLPVASNIKSYR